MSLFDQQPEPDDLDIFGDDLDIFGSVLPPGIEPGMPTMTPSEARRARKNRTVSDEMADILSHGTAETGGGKVIKAKANHSTRTREYWEKHGYRYERVDKAVSWSMKMIDYLGLWDARATKPGESDILIQICNVGHRTAHLRKMTSEAPASDNLKPRIDNLRWSLSRGRCYLHMWHQPEGPGKRWVQVLEEITHDTVEEFVSRKKGSRTRKRT